jgi:hypothetical protein
MDRSRREFLRTVGATVPTLTALALPSPSKSKVTPSPLSAQYKAAYERLREQYSLERVAKQKIEVTWDDLLGMATPLSKQVPVQACFHYSMLFVHPDLSLTLGREPGSLALGFALGTPAHPLDLNQASRKLHRGYQPIVESEWKGEPISVSQAVFGFLPKDEAVVTGKETQYVMIRMKLANSTNEPQRTALHLLVGTPCTMEGAGGANGLTALTGFVYGASHYPFRTSIARWQAGSFGIKMEGNGLFINNRVVLVFKSNVPTKVTFHEELINNGGDVTCPDKLNNSLQFDVALEPNETREIDIVAAGTSKLYPSEERDGMAAVTFADAIKRAESHWDHALAGGMRLTTPEPRLNDIYKGLILAGFGCISQNPGYNWREAYQTPFLWEVLPWEQAFHLNAMVSLGYHEAIEPCLRFFTEQQVGIGAHSASHGPVGAKSLTGSYPGQASSDWMNFTGSTLWMLANYYHYTRDTEWLKRNLPSILAAWEWVQGERARSYIVDDKGERVEYYGLMPPGRAGDWPEGSYLFTFTDNYTWYGMSEIAKAFREAGLPEADRFTKEAEEYRQCIVDVIHREEVVEPETGQIFVPNAAFYKKGYRASWWMADGPVQLFRTGLLKPDDKRFQATFELTKRKHGVLLGMHETYGHPEWYNNQTDHTYHKCYLARGEFEKALLTFYSSFVYGTSHDCYQTLERTNVYEPNYGSYQPNGSNIGRLLEMLKRMVIDEQEPGKLWLLRGCPRRWFGPGKGIEVENGVTYYGKLDLRIAPQRLQDEIQLELTLREDSLEHLESIYVRLPHPVRKKIQRVIVNGRNWKAFDPVKDIVELRPGGGHYNVTVQY